MGDTRHNDKSITLKEAAQISGYSSDYIGSLIRKEKIWGKRVFSDFGDYWVTTAEEVLQYRNGENGKAQGTYITLKEAAKISGYSSDYIGYLIRTKKIEGKRMSSDFGDYWVVSKDELARYQAEKNGKEHRQKEPAEHPFHERAELVKKISAAIQIFGTWKNPLSLLTRKSFNFLQTLSFSFLLLVGLTAFTVVALSPNEQTIEIFPTVSKGEWNNPDNALQRELDKGALLAEFSLANSAFPNVEAETLPDIQDTVTGQVEGVDPVRESQEQEGTVGDDFSNGVELAEPSEPVDEAIQDESATSTPEVFPPPEPLEQPPTTPTSSPEVQPPSDSQSSPQAPEEPTSQSIRQKLFSLFFSETEAQTEEQESSLVTDESINDITETVSPPVDGVEELSSDDEVVQETATSSDEELPNDLAKEDINTFTSLAEDGVEFIDIDIPSVDAESSSEEPSLTLFTSQQSVIYSGFTVPEGAGDLQRTAIGISLAFEGQEDNQDELLIDWSRDGEDWSNLVILNQDTQYSNNTNQDYLYIYLPGETTWEDISNLQVRLTALSTQQEQTRFPIYLDSIWIEATHIGGKVQLPKVRIHDSTEFVKAKKHFTSDEDILLVIEKPTYTKTELKQLILQSQAEMLEGRIEQLQDEESLLDAVGNTITGFLPFFGGDSTQQEEETTEEPIGGEPPLESLQGDQTGQAEQVEEVEQPQEEPEEAVPEGDEPRPDISGREPTEEPSPEEPTTEEEQIEEPSFDNAQDKPAEEPEPVVEPPSEETAEEPPTQEPAPEPSPVKEPVEQPPLESPEGDQTGQATESPTSELLRSLWGIQEAVAQKDTFRVTIVDRRGDESSVTPIITLSTQDGKEVLEVRISNSEQGFKPGRYTALIEVEENGVIVVGEYDFTWGVLAINVNKSIYSPEETAYIQMGVVNDLGHTVCTAQMQLLITSPSGVQARLSTQDGTIEYSDECSGNTYTSKPDYFGYVNLPQDIGVYEMELTAETQNGIYTITDHFEVRHSVPFDVERFGPTRIYPPAYYEVKFKIKPTQDFRGQVIETVPQGFSIQDLGSSNSLNSKFNILDSQNSKQIVWNVDWKAGETYELGYRFKAPGIFPYKWLLGPLSFDPTLFQSGSPVSSQAAAPPDLLSQAATQAVNFFGQLLNPPSDSASAIEEDEPAKAGTVPASAGGSDTSSTATSTDNDNAEAGTVPAFAPGWLEVGGYFEEIRSAFGSAFSEVRQWQIAADADIDYGTAQEFDADDVARLASAEIGTDAFGLCYTDGSVGQCIAASVSGTTITYGTEFPFSELATSSYATRKSVAVTNVQPGHWTSPEVGLKSSALLLSVIVPPASTVPAIASPAVPVSFR